METNNEEAETSSAMVNIGVRGSARLKDEISSEASGVGQTISEYAALILYNRFKDKDELEKLKQTLAERDKTIVELNAKAVKVEKLEAEIATYQKENVDLKKLVEKLSSENSIFQDKRLLYLYEHLKGKKERVKNGYGDDFDLLYDSPVAVLMALIYSSKLNK